MPCEPGQVRKEAAAAIRRRVDVQPLTLLLPARDFADTFLEKCHLFRMISKYVVLHQSDKILMVLRSYQYYPGLFIQIGWKSCVRLKAL